MTEYQILKPTGGPLPPDCKIIDGTDLYLMPGLSEMHAHIPVADGGDDTSVKEAMMLYLANGVTVIRGMLGQPYHLILREQEKNGEILSPRIYTSSPSMNGNSVASQEEARKKVAQAAKDGYDFLKIHPGIKSDVMSTLVETAREKGIGYAGHVPLEVGIDQAIDYGYQSIDHLDGYMEGMLSETSDLSTSDGGFFGYLLADQLEYSKIERLAAKTASKGVWVVPTQSLFTRWVSPTPGIEMVQEPEMKYISAKLRYSWSTGKDRMIKNLDYSVSKYKKFIEARRHIVRSLHDHKVKFLLGSDSPQVMNVPGFSIHHEIDALVDAGIPVYDVLRSGTAHPALFFNKEEEYGTIAIGLSADMILVEDNPLRNHKTLRRPEGVFIKGQYLSREFLDEQLERIAKRHETSMIFNHK